MSTGPPAPECLRSVLQKAAMKRKPDSEGRQSPLCDVEGISTMIVGTCQYLFGFFSNTGSNDTPFDINSNQSFIILKFQSIWRWLRFLQKKITHIQGAFLVQDKSKLAFPFSCVIQAWRPFSTLRLTWYVQAEWSPAHTPLLVLRYDRSLYKILLITLPETKTFYLRHNLPSFTTAILACLHLRLPKEWTMETGDKWGKRGVCLSDAKALFTTCKQQVYCKWRFSAAFFGLEKVTVFIVQRGEKLKTLMTNTKVIFIAQTHLNAVTCEQTP